MQKKTAKRDVSLFGAAAPVAPVVREAKVVKPHQVPAALTLLGADEGIAAAASRPKFGAERGVTGLVARQGRVMQEYNANLQSLSSRMTAYEEMRRSDCAFATIEALITMPLLQADFRIQEGTDTDFSEFLQWNLFHGLTNNFKNTLRSAIMGVLYGFTWHYKQFEYKDYGGRRWVGLRKLAERERSTVYNWKFDDTGGLAGLVQRGYSPSTGQLQETEYDVSEILVWTWRPEAGNPEGIGAFRQAYKHWFYKVALEEFAAIRIERQACGIPVAYGPPEGYTDSEKAEVLALLGGLRTAHNGAVVIPDGWRLELLTLGAADVPFETHIERQHRSILETVLAHFVETDNASQGVSRDSSNLFLMSLEAIADWLCDVVNTYLIPQLAQYNGVSTTDGDLPKLVHGKVGVRDLDRFTRAVKAIFDGGIEYPPEVQDYLREVAGLPAAPQGESDDEGRWRPGTC